MEENVKGFKMLLEERKKIVKKWKDSGLLDGLREMKPHKNLALLLESQSRQFIFEPVYEIDENRIMF